MRSIAFSTTCWFSGNNLRKFSARSFVIFYWFSIFTLFNNVTSSCLNCVHFRLKLHELSVILMGLVFLFSSSFGLSVIKGYVRVCLLIFFISMNAIYSVRVPYVADR